MNLNLTRFYYGVDAVLGGIMIEGMNHRPIYTLEQAWKDNQRNVSCIPAGIYKCRPYTSFNFKNVYQVLDVPERSHILIHIGNTHYDTRGCILVGFSAGELATRRGTPAVLASGDAMNFLRTTIKQQSFNLTIRGLYEAA